MGVVVLLALMRGWSRLQLVLRGVDRGRGQDLLAITLELIDVSGSGSRPRPATARSVTQMYLGPLEIVEYAAVAGLFGRRIVMIVGIGVGVLVISASLLLLKLFIISFLRNVRHVRMLRLQVCGV